MAAYLIAQLDVKDPEGAKAYQAAVPAVVERFGGRYLVRGGATEVLEGELAATRLVVIEFPDLAAARRFYASPEYQAILPHRLRSCEGSLALVEGLAGAAPAAAG